MFMHSFVDKFISISLFLLVLSSILLGRFVLPSFDRESPTIGYDFSYDQNTEFSWNLNILDIPDAWQYTKGNENITVAIIDSGVVWSDELPESRRWNNQIEINGLQGADDDENGFVDDYYGWDFVDGDNTPNEDKVGVPLWHGTAVAGIIGALQDDDILTGIAPNVKIMDLRVLDDEGFGFIGNMQRAIEYAMFQNVSVINLSSFFDNNFSEYDLWVDLLKNVTDMNIPVVGISGNQGHSNIVFPAQLDTVIATGSVTDTGELFWSSNFGPEIELVAPGHDVPSVRNSGEIMSHFGTSFAAPHVTGTIALMKSLRDDLNVNFLRKTLHYAATDIDDIGFDNHTGYGIVNTSKSLEAWNNFEVLDYDSDGLTNQFEISVGLDISINDTDGDGLPDGFEINYNFDPLDPIDAQSDPDGDGLTNIQEYLRGSNPLNKYSTQKPQNSNKSILFYPIQFVVIPLFLTIRKKLALN